MASRDFSGIKYDPSLSSLFLVPHSVTMLWTPSKIINEVANFHSSRKPVTIAVAYRSQRQTQRNIFLPMQMLLFWRRPIVLRTGGAETDGHENARHDVDGPMCRARNSKTPFIAGYPSCRGKKNRWHDVICGKFAAWLSSITVSHPYMYVIHRHIINVNCSYSQHACTNLEATLFLLCLCQILLWCSQWRSVGGGRGGRPERHLSKRRHIEVSKNFRLSFSVQKGTKKVQKIIPAYFLVCHS